MYGTRIITGEFSLYTKGPRRLTSLLEKAAKNRESAENKSPLGRNSVVTRMTAQNQNAGDQLNLEKYWSMSQLDRVTSDPATSQINTNNIFSAHPPFNFIILYGAEEVSFNYNSLLTDSFKNIEDELDRMSVSDVNQRSVRIDKVSSPMKIVLQQVNLMSMGTSYSPGGQPVMETYQFMARDFYFSEVDLSFVKNIPTVDTSGYDSLLDQFGGNIEPISTSYTIDQYNPF